MSSPNEFAAGSRTRCWRSRSGECRWVVGGGPPAESSGAWILVGGAHDASTVRALRDATSSSCSACWANQMPPRWPSRPQAGHRQGGSIRTNVFTVGPDARLTSSECTVSPSALIKDGADGTSPGCATLGGAPRPAGPSDRLECPVADGAVQGGHGDCRAEVQADSPTADSAPAAASTATARAGGTPRRLNCRYTQAPAKAAPPGSAPATALPATVITAMRPRPQRTPPPASSRRGTAAKQERERLAGHGGGQCGPADMGDQGVGPCHLPPVRTGQEGHRGHEDPGSRPSSPSRPPGLDSWPGSRSGLRGPGCRGGAVMCAHRPRCLTPTVDAGGPSACRSSDVPRSAVVAVP